ncbi:MAG: hypothetical protein K9M99_04340 [Candidatus Cloacimonetes bacterium]|nr:hypothetical protein [Candidatus Cloacimonadota bacterium]
MFRLLVTGIFLLVMLFPLLGQIDLSWNTPACRNEIKFSWLQDTDEIIPASKAVAQEYDLAISGWRNFVKSLSRYISRSDEEGVFFQYQPAGSSDIWLQISLQAGADYAAVTDSSYYFTHYGWLMQGHIGEKLSFYTQFWAGHFGGDSDFVLPNSPLIDSWLKYQNDTYYLDNIRGKLLYTGNYLDAALGRGKYEIGSNIAGSIILSDVCNDYGYISLDFKLGDLRFSLLNASLTADSSSVNFSDEYKNYRYNEDKYLTIHKIDWTPSQKLHFFLGEEVIYGSHDAEISYLLPFNFIRAIEHNLGDHDNVIIFAGWEWKYAQNLFWYGNLVLDELRKSEIIGDWWGNKYALQTGNTFYFGQHKFSLEFTAVRPWLYTHKSIYTRYSHDKKGLGFPEGSNLMQIAAALELQLSDRMILNCLAAFIRQGETGNNWSINYQNEITDIDNEETKWFGGNPENRYKLQGVISWQLLAHHWLKLGADALLRDDEDDLQLYISWFTRY